MKLSSLLTFALVACTALAGSALELSDFVLSPVRPRGIAATQPAADGTHYYQLSADHSSIRRHSYKNDLTDDVVVAAGELAGDKCDADEWDGYKMSADESKVLLWTDSRSIYRHSFSADYWVCDVKSQRLTKLSQGGAEEIATLSPDGTMVAYVKGNNIVIRNLATGDTLAVTTDGEKNRVINGVPDWVYQEEFGLLNSMTWSADSRHLAFIRFDESQVPMCSMTLYQGDCNANDDYALYPGTYDFKYPVAGQKNSVVSVMCYDVVAGKLSKMPVPLADDDYVPHIDFGVSRDHLMVSRLNRTQNRFSIFAVNPLTGECGEVYGETSDSWIDSELLNQVTYYADFFVLPSDKSGRAQLYRCSLDGAQQQQLTTADEDVTRYYGYDAKRQRYYYQCTAGPLNRQVRYIDAAGQSQALSPAEGTSGATFSPTFDYYISTFSDRSTPTRYTVCNHKGRKVRTLQDNADYAERYCVQAVPKREPITVQSDSYSLNGYIIKPADFNPAKKYPVIMVQYSGPNSQQVRNSWGLDWQEYFATQGFIIACVDGRGTGGRGKAFQSVVYKNLGHYESIDQHAAARYMASLPYVDAEHIGIWGWSYGGYEALMAMSTPGFTYAAGVAIAPVTSWKFYDTIYTERYMRTPQENPDGYASSPLDLVKDQKGELLIMFGSADDNVHIINSMQYISRLHGLNRQFDMMVFPNMNHSINGCDVRLPLYQRVLNFFTRTLKPTSAK